MSELRRLSPIERAFELARSGTVSAVEVIEDILNREGYPSRILEGPRLRKQLKALIIDAKSGGSPPKGFDR